MNSNRGFVEWIVVAVLIGIVSGAVSFHYIVLSGYKREIKQLAQTIKDKETVIEKMATEKAEVLAEATALRAANTLLSADVERQNKALDALKKERDDSLQRWQRAEQEAIRGAAEYEARIAGILATQPQPGEVWYDAWSKTVADYYKVRRP